MGSVELQKVAEKMNLKNLTSQIWSFRKRKSMCRILTARRYSSQAFLNIFESDRVQVVGYVRVYLSSKAQR